MRRLLITIVFSVTGLLMAGSASAHDLPIERSAVLQLHAAHAELLLIYSEPPGPRTDRLLALYDANRNGRIDGPETVIAEGAMLARAFLGFELVFSRAIHGKNAPKVRFRRSESGGISVAVFQRFDFVAVDDVLAIDVVMEDAVGIPPLKLIVEPTDDWKFSDDDTAEKSVMLQPGGVIQYVMTRVDPPRADPKRPAEKNWRPTVPNVDALR